MTAYSVGAWLINMFRLPDLERWDIGIKFFLKVVLCFFVFVHYDVCTDFVLITKANILASRVL